MQMLSINLSEFENMEVKSHPIDYDALFCEIVMKDYNV